MTIQDSHVNQDTVSRCQNDAYAPVPDPDSTAAYLALAVEEINHAIEYLKAACRDSRVDESLGEFTLDALRGIRDEIEAESR